MSLSEGLMSQTHNMDTMSFRVVYSFGKTSYYIPTRKDSYTWKRMHITQKWQEIIFPFYTQNGFNIYNRTYTTKHIRIHANTHIHTYHMFVSKRQKLHNYCTNILNIWGMLLCAQYRKYLPIYYFSCWNSLIAVIYYNLVVQQFCKLLFYHEFNCRRPNFNSESLVSNWVLHVSS